MRSKRRGTYLLEALIVFQILAFFGLLVLQIQNNRHHSILGMRQKQRELQKAFQKEKAWKESISFSRKEKKSPTGIQDLGPADHPVIYRP